MITTIFYQKVLITIILIFTVLFTGCDKQPIVEKQVNVIFRFDDYSARSSTEMELKIIDIFRKNEACVTFGVIPFVLAGDVQNPSLKDTVSLTSKKGNILKTGFEDGILDIALHGYSHQTNDPERNTEFSGLDYTSQVERLTKGKKFLENMIDAPITIFVPPWSQYDLNTLRALEELGFSTLSANRKGPATENSKLNFLPVSCELQHLRDAVKSARSSSDHHPLIVVLFHEYDFREIDEKLGSITIQEFYDLLNWLKSQKYVRLMSISQATKVFKDLSANRLLQAKRHYSIDKLLPSFLREKESVFLYRESSGLQKTLLRVGGFYLMIVILVTVFSFIMGCIVFPMSAFIMNISTFGSIVLSAILLVYAIYDPQVSPKGMVIRAGVIGGCIGLCICFQYLKRKRIWVCNSADKKDHA